MNEINHECYVSLEVAKLLKEAGFDWECASEYTKEGNFIHILRDTRGWEDGEISWNSLTEKEAKLIGIAGWKNGYSAPTLDVAQRWLREVKCISVEIGIDIHGEWKVLCCKYPINNKWLDDWCLLDDTDETNPSYSTYEEAQEAGIKKALELILKN